MRWGVKNVTNDADNYIVERFEDRKCAVEQRDYWRRKYPAYSYTVVRLVTKREKLKRKLLRDSRRYDSLSAGGEWYSGYARALRDIASQL